MHEVASRLTRRPATDALPERILVVGDEATTRAAAAEALAGELQRPIQRVDLSQIDHKHLAETEKAIEQLLARAEESDSILLLDEADALFGDASGHAPDEGNTQGATVWALLRHQLEHYAGPVVLGAAQKPAADQIAAGRIASVITLGVGRPPAVIDPDLPSRLHQRRDLHLIRLILRQVEKLPLQATGRRLSVPGEDAARVDFHLALLIEAGLVRGTLHQSGMETAARPLVTGLTWAGHNAFALLDDPTAWSEAATQLLDQDGRADFESLLHWLRQRKARSSPA